MTQVLHLSFRWNKFFVSLLISIQSIVSVSGWLSPHNFEMFSISPHQAYSSRCWNSNNSIQPFFVRMLFQIQFWDKLSSSSPFFLPNDLYTILSFRRLCDVALFNHHLVLSRSYSPLLVILTGVLYSSFKIPHLI